MRCLPISSKSGKFLFRGGQYNENNPLRIAIKGQEILQNRQRIVKEKWKSRDGNNQSASTGGPIGGGVTAAILTLTLPTPPSLSLSLCLSSSSTLPLLPFSPFFHHRLPILHQFSHSPSFYLLSFCSFAALSDRFDSSHAAI